MLFTLLVKKRYGIKGGLHCNRYCKLNSRVVIGNNVHMNGLKIYGSGKVQFGDNFHSGKNIKIYTNGHIYESDHLPYGYGYKISDCIIGDNVWLGDNVTLIAPVEIGEGAVIGFGSVVRGDVPDLAVVIGNPAITVKNRDSERYQTLKTEKKFR